jgi:proline racemase
MRAGRTLTVVGCHAGGEIGNVIVGGVLPPRGATVFEQMESLRRDGDWLRRVLLREPRGSVACHANLVVPPTRDDCDAGFIIMEPTEYPAMSGSNTICTTTVLLETGMVEMREPETVVRLEAPGGVVEARAACRDGKCESVEFTNVPCFVGQLDAELEVEGIGGITVDVAYGGMWYAIADSSALGFELVPEEARPRWRARRRPRRASSSVRPSGESRDAGVSTVQIAEPWRGVGEVTATRRHAPGGTHRSATGTGLRRASRAPRPRPMKPGDSMTHASPIGSTFEGRIVEETRVGDRPAIVPRSAAAPDHRCDAGADRPERPVPEGYLLSDTWGVSGLDSQCVPPQSGTLRRDPRGVPEPAGLGGPPPPARRAPC